MVNQSNVIIKPEIIPLLKNIEIIVFDIDGVLIDVSGSFRKTIVDTVQYFFKKILKFKGKEKLVKTEEIKLFKNAGGFNNDWELTEIFALFYLAKSILLNTKDLAVLRFQEPYLDGFIVSDIQSFEKAVFRFLSEKEINIVRGLWNKPLIRQLFKEMYAGSKYNKTFYGHEPIYFKGKGTIENEIPLLDANLINRKVAIITGRTETETKAALHLLGLKVDNEMVICDNGKLKRKPDPQSLNYISDKMNIKLGLYIGDTMDDFLLVKNFNEQDNGKRFLSSVITASAESFKAADIVALSVNEVLKTVINAS